jgi:hypothetical protein
VIYYDSETGKIESSLTNKWDAISVAVHEKYHADHTGESNPGDVNHVYAIIAQTEHWSFDHLSDATKKGQAWYAVNLLNESFGKRNVTKDMIQERLNDLNNSKLGVDGGGGYFFFLDGMEVKSVDMSNKKEVEVKINEKK